MLADSGSPTHSDLVADLRVVREKGLGHLRRYATPALAVACTSSGTANDDSHRPAAVEALRHAVTKMGGGKSGEAASYTFGLVQGTRLWTSTDRRKAAAKAQGVSVERFRKGYESVLIDEVAEGILTLLYERGQQQSSSQSETASAQASDIMIEAGQTSITTTPTRQELAANYTRLESSISTCHAQTTLQRWRSFSNKHGATSCLCRYHSRPRAPNDQSCQSSYE